VTASGLERAITGESDRDPTSPDQPTREPLLLPCPVLVWGADELFRRSSRRRKLSDDKGSKFPHIRRSARPD
jgi:hypothetical protein